MLQDTRGLGRAAGAWTRTSVVVRASRRWAARVLHSPSAAALAFAAFAGVTLLTGMPAQRVWAGWALGGYLLGGALLWAKPHSRAPIVVIIVVTLLCPLLQLSTSWEGQHEIWVVQHAAERLLRGTTLYPMDPESLSDVNDYFPYLPGLAVFGIPGEIARALQLPRAFGDVRWTFAAVFFAAAVVALRPANRFDRRISFWLLASPMVTLPLATGGSDLPVVALMLLALARSARGSSWQAGILTGFACAVKLMAWPFALALGLMTIARRSGAQAARFATASLTMIVVLVVPCAVASARGFVVHELAFPTGLAPAGSPAATPNVGRMLSDAVPGGRWVAIGLLISVAAVFVAWMVIRPPTSERAVAWTTAAGVTAAAVLLPASRIGYVVYPLAMGLFALGLGKDGAKEGR